MALSIDRYCAPAANVNVLSIILVRLFRAGTSLRGFVCARRTAGDSFPCLKYDVESINLKVAVASSFVASR
jgi:hypothetical protein